MNRSLFAIKTAVIIPVLVLIATILMPAPVQAQATAELRCSTGGYPVSCEPYAEAIRSIGGDPNDPTQCFVATVFTNLAPTPCDQGIFATHGSQQQQEANREAALAQIRAREAEEAARQGVENPGRVSCDSTQSCIDDNPLLNFLVLVLNVLGGAVAIIVVIVIVLAGIQYSTAGGNPNTTAVAKKRILNAIIAFIAYLGLYMVFQWLIPGGFV